MDENQPLYQRPDRESLSAANASAQDAPTKRRRFGLWLKGLPFLKILKWGTLSGLAVGFIAFIALCIFIFTSTRDLPTLQALRDYAPAEMSRVHAGDGKLIAEYGIEKRVFVPIDQIPLQMQHALIASEDQRFYSHQGFDARGFTRAMITNVKNKVAGVFTGKNKRLEGASTLTQQVARNFLVGDDYNVRRKVREIAIARRIEKATSKDRIMELYLNEVFFARRSYGIAGASLNYFNQPLDQLTLAQAAYLAGLVKGPNNYQPEDNMEKAINRRNYVLNRMAEDGFISAEEAKAAKAEPLKVTERLYGDEYLAADYFVAEVRKQLGDLYGEKELIEGGMSIRTTLDTKMQLEGRRALRRGLEMYDRRHGYRGPIGKMEKDILANDEQRKEFLGSFKLPPDIAPWKLAVVRNVKKDKAALGFASGDDGTMLLSDILWAKPALEGEEVGEEPKNISDVIKQGDLILVQDKPGKKNAGFYNLRQVPLVNGGLIAMDPHTGRILTLVGGYSFSQSQFNRAVQAYRQPGSAFKPFVYAAALDSDFTPASQVLDAPFVIRHNDRDERCLEQEGKGLVELQFGQADEDGQIEDETPQPVPAEITDEEELGEEAEEEECGPIFYKPANFNAGRFYGLSTLRLGLEKSRNAMTVRLANDIGMTKIGRYGRRFGIYDETKPELAWALGAGESTLMRMAAAYATLVNGGKKVTPTLLDRVQDEHGKTVYIHDQRECLECAADDYFGGPPPELPDMRADVLSPVTAYQITSMLEGVVERGTGRSIKALERPMAGKTGTTNDYKDAWFMGFSPDLVAGVYVGFDAPRSMGKETGGLAAAPIFRDFMGAVLKNTPKTPFRIPEGVLLVPVDKVTGEASYIGAPNFIYEAFRPGTEPRLGANRGKISIGGSGYQDGQSYDFGFGDPNANAVPENTSLSPENSADGSGLRGNIAAAPNSPATAAPKQPPLRPAPQPQVQPEEKPKKSVLDEGLY